MIAMKKSLYGYCALGALLCILRTVDLALFTDLESGLCTAGPVWVRYLVLAAVVGAGALLGRRRACGTAQLSRRHPALAVLAFAAALAYGAAALAGAAALLAGPAGIAALVQPVLSVLCALWFFRIGRSWLADGSYAPPTRSLAFAAAGSAVFYWGVLAGFLQNSSSWHRLTPTTAIWQQLAALLFLAALTRVLYLPEEPESKHFGSTALAAFALCLCWELPQAAALWLAGQRTGAEGLAGIGMCAVGLLAAGCALAANSPESKETV